MTEPEETTTEAEAAEQQADEAAAKDSTESGDAA